MTLVHRLRYACVAALLSASATFAANAQAQELPESHVKAAMAAIASINATDNYDGILLQAASTLKQQLILQNPDLEALITNTVDETALSMVGRRGDLEREAALIYARLFSEDELKTIATFYNSEAGKKLLDKGPEATRAIAGAVQIWQNGVTRDLTEAATQKISQIVQAQAKDAPAGGSEQPAAPAQ